MTLPEQVGPLTREQVDRLLVVGLRVLLVVLAAVLVRWLVCRTIDRVVERLGGVDARVRHHLRRVRSREDSDVLAELPASERRGARARTIGALAKSVTTIAIAAVTGVVVLAEFGVDVVPVVASAGVVGVALAFGAQNLVKDFLAGVLMLLEDQYGVGDVIDMGPATGTVEAVGLRITTLRAVDGTAWYVRNGEVQRVGNMSQEWARAVVDVPVGYAEDLGRVRELLLAAASAVRDDPDFARDVLGDPEVWGVELLGGDTVSVRLVVRTAPGEQFRVSRELRERSLRALREGGVAVPAPTRPAPAEA